MELDLLFKVTPGNRKVQEVIEYGDHLVDIMGGELPGPNGACFDFHVVANIEGVLSGTTRAVVTMSIKPDGATSLKLHETLTLHDGGSILMEGMGISLPGEKPGWVKAKGAFKFYTTSRAYTWVNATMAVFEVWGDPAGDDFNLRAYSIQ